MFKKFTGSSMAIEPISTAQIVSSLEEEAQTVIAEGVQIKGSLQFKRQLRIDGHFEGQILASGSLVVGPTGVVISDVHLQEAVICGRLKGNITVTHKLCLQGNAHIEGNIRAPQMSVESGVCIQGHVDISPLEPSTSAEDDDDHYNSDH